MASELRFAQPTGEGKFILETGGLVLVLAR